jgi:DNA-binding MarR family transcriptional regulator
MSVSPSAPLPFDPVDEARRHWADHGWVAAAPGMAAVTSVMRAQQIFLGRVEEVLRPLGLTFARYELLMLLSFSSTGAMPLGKVSARLQVHPTSVTNAVDRLEAQGFIRRLPHATDRRATLAEILPEGRQIAQVATKELNQQVFERTGLDPADIDALTDVLRRLRSGFGDFEVGDPGRGTGPT